MLPSTAATASRASKPFPIFTPPRRLRRSQSQRAPWSWHPLHRTEEFFSESYHPSRLAILDDPMLVWGIQISRAVSVLGCDQNRSRLQQSSARTLAETPSGRMPNLPAFSCSSPVHISGASIGGDRSTNVGRGWFSRLLEISHGKLPSAVGRSCDRRCRVAIVGPGRIRRRLKPANRRPVRCD